MRICFENKSDETTAVLSIDNKIENIMPESRFECEISGDSVTFFVVYARDFTFNSGEKQSKLSKIFFDDIGDLIVQIKNTYKVGNLSDGDIIELYEKAHYVPTTKREALYKCIPALYYFGQAECEKAQISVENSVVLNREKFIKSYKAFFRVMNLSGWFRILKYSKQMKRQKKICSDKTVTAKFRELYAMSTEDRAYQFKPLLVIFDRIIEGVLGKFPKRIRAKLSGKIEEIRDLFK